MGFLWLQHLRLGLWQHAQWERLEAGAESERAITLRLNDQKDVVWENGREFRYGGELYDALSLRALVDGGWELRAISDREEGRMRADFEAFLAGRHSAQGDLGGRPTESLPLLNYVEVSTLTIVDGGSMASGFWEYDWAMDTAPAFPPEGHPPAVC